MTREFFSLAPQMREYLMETNVYLPYLMHFQRPHIRRSSFTTDEFGFRQTMLGQTVLSLQQFNRLSPSDKPCALLGNSTAFGVGASNDANTVASRLNQLGWGAWFNFSGRTLNPFQEALAFMMFAKVPVDTAVILSGINLFDMNYRYATDAHQWVPPFYAERIFFRGLRKRFLPALREWVTYRWKHVLGDPIELPSGFDSGSLLHDLQGSLNFSDLLHDSGSVERALENFGHVLSVLRAFQPRKIGRLIFALQPVPEWFGRPLSQIEQKLSAIVDRHRGEKWRAVHQYLLGHAKEFRVTLEAVCHRQSVEFLDLNMCPELLGLEWVFIDRYHLTDDAQACIASILHAAVSRKTLSNGSGEASSCLIS